jgi:hypothetical protein
VSTIGEGERERVIAHWQELLAMVGVASCGVVAVATRGLRRRGMVEWKFPDCHAVAAHQPNIPDSLV